MNYKASNPGLVFLSRMIDARHNLFDETNGVESSTPERSPLSSVNVIAHRSGRAAATWAASALYTLVTLSVAFVTTPLLLRYLGQERLGAYRAANEWIGYLSLIDLGITPAIGVLVLRARHNRADPAGQTAAVVRGGLVLLAVIAVATASVGLAVVGLMPRLVPVSPELRYELSASSMLLVVLVLFLPFQMSRMLIEAEQRGYWSNFALLLQAVITAVLSVVLARAGLGLAAQSAALVVGSAVGTTIFLVPTWRWYVTRPPRGIRAVTPQSIWRLGWPLALSGLGIRLNLMSDSLVVAYVLGPTAVFTLFVTQRAVSLFGGQVNGIINASWAALAELRMTGQQDAFVAGMLELTSLVVGVGTALTGTVAAFNAHFVRLWVGSDHYGGNALSYLTATAAVVVGLTTVYGFCLDSAGETAARIPVSVGGAIINLMLSVALTKSIGLPGVILGTVIACAASDAWFCPFLVSRRFGVPGLKIASAVAAGVARGLPLVVIAALFAKRSQPCTWSAFLFETLVGGILSLGYVWLAVLTHSERHRWAGRFVRYVPARFRHDVFPR